MNNGVNINAEVPKTTQNSSPITSPTTSSTIQSTNNTLNNAVKVAGQANDILTSPNNNYGIWLVALVWLVFAIIILGVLFRNKITAFIRQKLK